MDVAGEKGNGSMGKDDEKVNGRKYSTTFWRRKKMRVQNKSAKENWGAEWQRKHPVGTFFGP